MIRDFFNLKNSNNNGILLYSVQDLFNAIENVINFNFNYQEN